MESFVEKHVHHFGCRLRCSPQATPLTAKHFSNPADGFF